MNTTELLNIFSTFTKDNWIEFDRIKNLTFQPSQEELEEQIKQQKEYKQNLINSKLKTLWIERQEIITIEFALWLLEIINAKQFVWADLEWWLKNQIILFWDLETAFNELILRYL